MEDLTNVFSKCQVWAIEHLFQQLVMVFKVESNQIYNEEEIVHSGWVVASQKLSHNTQAPPLTPTPPHLPVN